MPDLSKPIQSSKMKLFKRSILNGRDDPGTKALSRGGVNVDYEAQSVRRSEGSRVSITGGIKAGAFRSVWKKVNPLRKPLFA
jgi:hypothetical protein